MGTEQKDHQPNHSFFGFTEQEQLFNRIGNERFLALLQDTTTTVHTAELSANSFGEFFFLTVSRPAGETREAATFFGLGFHEQRERWITDAWTWYRTNLWPDIASHSLEKADILTLIEERTAEIAPYIDTVQQSQRAKLYEVLADLTDEDGALIELEDLDDWLDDEL